MSEIGMPKSVVGAVVTRNYSLHIILQETIVSDRVAAQDSNSAI